MRERWRRFKQWRARRRREDYELRVWLDITRDYPKETAQRVND